jgi:hypothetical protein
MPASTVIKHWKDGKLTLKDGTTPAAVALVVPLSMGDLKVQGLSADMTDDREYRVRGQTETVRKGESVHPSGSFSAALADLSDVTSTTVYDYIRKTGSYSANKSTMSGSTSPSGDIFTYDIEWAIEGTDLGDSTDHTLTMTKCKITMDISEGEPNTFSFSFVCYGSTTAV